MRTLAAGSKHHPAPARGFTLMELLVVVALIAVATAGVSLSLRDSAESALERDAERLAALLETGRAQARAQGVPVVWLTSNAGIDFEFAGLPPPGLPRTWLNNTTRAVSGMRVILGPEPLIEPQALALSSTNAPGKNLWVVTDGLRPFRVQSSPDGTGSKP
jgi:general secretion pathway protein H